jgi:pyruvate/2-oxoglutarate dehydrogenase complex dihydrolipoamide dehydrogenase (E3) component
VQVTANAGNARFVDAHTLALGDGSTVRGRRFLVCAGGHARRLPFAGSEDCLTHSDIWTLQALPRSMVIVGAAATGCQLASVFAAFGTSVTMLEVAPRILGPEDADVADALTDALRRRGITIVTGIAGVDGVEARGGGSRLVRFSVGEEAREVEAEAVVVAVGWVGSTGELGLDVAGVETERGYIKVDDTLRTSVPHIYAAGDITGRLMLVQTASGEARLAVDNAILGLDATEDRAVVPHGGFTDPEYAGVGLTQTAAEAHAAEGGEPIAVALVPYSDLDRAVIDGHAEGFGKLVVGRRTRRILGAHVVGEQAVEVVQVAAAGMAAGMLIEQLAEMEIAYPTYTAVLGLAARQLVRELGVVPISPQWRALGRARLAEWERRTAEEGEESE